MSAPSPQPLLLRPPAWASGARGWLAALSALLALGGCASTDGDADGVDYRSASARSVRLDVPPDLSALPQDSRYATLPGGAVSAGAPASPTAVPTPLVQPPSAVATSGGAVAPTQLGAVTLQRDGAARWLQTSQTPEALWPKLRSFWTDGGFTIVEEDAAAGYLQTDWAEDRSKIPQDIIRRSIGKLFENLYDSGLRDRFRMRVERSPAGTEITLSHQGMSEDYTDSSKQRLEWRPRPSDPELEATMLRKLQAYLGGEPGAAATATAASAREPVRFSANEQGGTIEIDDGLERAWRRLQLAVDRQGLAVMARDREAGTLTLSTPDTKTEASVVDKLLGREAKAQRPSANLKLEAISPTQTRLSLGSAPQDDWARDLLKTLAPSLR